MTKQADRRDVNLILLLLSSSFSSVLSYYFSLTSAVPAGTSIAAAQKHISLSLLSVVASTGSSTAAYVVQLQQCIANAIMVPTAECVGPVAINAPLMATTTIVCLPSLSQSMVDILPLRLNLHPVPSAVPTILRIPSGQLDHRSRECHSHLACIFT